MSISSSLLKINRYYIGYSQNPLKRLEFHNSEFNKIWSRRGQPWQLKTTTPLPSKKEAIIVEKKIKSFKNKATIKNIIEKGWQKAESGESS